MITILTNVADLRTQKDSGQEEREDLTAGFGATIRMLREFKKLTQKELANRAGIARTGIAAIETGQQRLTTEQLSNIAKALHVEIQILFSDIAQIARMEEPTPRWGDASRSDRQVAKAPSEESQS